jgi:hypothetical protein
MSCAISATIILDPLCARCGEAFIEIDQNVIAVRGGTHRATRLCCSHFRSLSSFPNGTTFDRKEQVVHKI